MAKPVHKQEEKKSRLYRILLMRAQRRARLEDDYDA